MTHVHLATFRREVKQPKKHLNWKKEKTPQLELGGILLMHSL